MVDFLKMSLKAGGGVAALGAALFYSVSSGIIEAKILAALSSEQTYNICLCLIGAAVFCAICLFLIHASGKAKNGITASGGSHVVITNGNENQTNVGNSGK